MYYLAKFCRICIQTGGNMEDIESEDYDLVKFSEKLKACTEMVISRESLSTQICTLCIQKLRVAYQFHNMCKRSTSVLQSYLTELLSVSKDITADQFVNSELVVPLSTKLPKHRRKRVGKEERCSLLKRLLTKITQEQIMHNIHINGMSKLCEQIIPNTTTSEYDNYTEKQYSKAGGLYDLLNFTKHFDFDYKMNSDIEPCKNFDLTPIEKLTRFTETFFYDHFGDYRDVILHIRDMDNETSDEEQMFDHFVTEPRTEVTLESPAKIKNEIISPEPRVKIKKEIDILEPDINVKREIQFEEEPSVEDSRDSSEDYDISSRFVQACYGTESETKEENRDLRSPPQLQTVKYFSNNNFFPSIPMLESALLNKRTFPQYRSDIFFPRGPFVTSEHPSTPNSSFIYSSIPSSAVNEELSALQLMAQIPYSIPPLKRHRNISPYSIKCRTRGNPFISPQLKNQFQTRSFKCNTCERRFKSPGYLKAHCSRLMH